MIEITQEEKVIKPIVEMSRSELLREIGRMDYYILSHKERDQKKEQKELEKRKKKLEDYMAKDLEKRAIAIVSSKDDFSEGVEIFSNYKAVKVPQDLITDFNTALINFFLKEDVKWESDQTPMKSHCKFKRVKLKN